VDHASRTLRWFGNRLLPRPLLFGRKTSTGKGGGSRRDCRSKDAMNARVDIGEDAEGATR
jgi:hypothetical protein